MSSGRMATLFSILHCFLSLLLLLIPCADSSRLPPAGAQLKPPQPMQRRELNQVAACEAALTELRASVFCTSLLGLHDVTQTITLPNRSGRMTATEQATPCTTVGLPRYRGGPLPWQYRLTDIQTQAAISKTSTVTSFLPGVASTTTFIIPAATTLDTISVPGPTDTLRITLPGAIETVCILPSI